MNKSTCPKPEYQVGEPVVAHGTVINKIPDTDYGGFMYEIELSKTLDPFWVRGDALFNTRHDDGV